MMDIITSLINIASGGSWLDHPFLHILLMIDGMIYQLVSYAFNLFLLMCSVNYNSIAGLASNLIDNLKAIIMVLVVYKLGISLLQYMIKPEDAQSNGSKIVTNIFITAALLISYNFIFSVFNELGMMIMGNPTNYPYTTLSTIADVTASDADNKGLIMRFVFGADSDSIDDVGDFLAYSTMSIFLHDYGNEESSTNLRNEICDDEGKCDFSRMKNLSSDIDQTVEFHWGISSIVGIYLIYTIVKSAIQIGIRMFKLLILQILAPVAIITIIKDGTKSSVFQKYIKTYGSVFAEAFIRMLTMLIIVVFVCKFFINKSDFFGSLSAEGGWVNFLITIVLVIAAFKFAGDIPKFIGQIFPGLGESAGGGKGGFGKLLSGIVGGGIGAVAGLAGGVTAGINAGAGVLGTVGNAFAGAASGASGGIKGKNISDKIKNISAASGKNNLARAQNIVARGGLGAMASGAALNLVGYGKRADTRVSNLQAAAKAVEAYDKGTAALLKQTGAKASVADTISKGFASGAENVKMKSKDEYKMEMRQYNTALQQAIADRETAISSGDTAAIEAANYRIATETQKSDDAASELYEDARAALVSTNEHAKKLDADVRATFKNAKYKDSSGQNRELTLTNGDGGRIDVKKDLSAAENAQYSEMDRSAYFNTHPPGKK